MPQNVWKEIPKKVKGIAYVREPYQPIPQVTSEGVAKIGAVEYQNNAGITGKNVKVAVIDVGFIGLSAAQAAGELPSSVITQDYTGDGIEATSAHGVAVSEIIYDIAPDASFYLIKIANDVHFKEAIEEWCIPQGIKIINLSLGWLAVNFCDGTGDICNTANSARTNGILFIQAMGNYAQRHYQGIFTPYVFSGYTVHDFDETADVDISNAIYATAGSLIRAYLTWDAWPSTAEDYDLWLGYVSNGTLYIVAWSQNRQATGEYPAPREMLSYNVTVTRWYHLLICY
jgi:subtilisin family serine protease